MSKQLDVFMEWYNDLFISRTVTCEVYENLTDMEKLIIGAQHNTMMVQRPMYFQVSI